MSDFGITPTGFVLKPLQAILNDKAALAQAVFGDDIDLRSTSSLRKILDISSAADLDLWKLAESLYYSSFLSTASGNALDLLGDDLGVPRDFLNAQATVQLTLQLPPASQTPGRVYNIPSGTVVETDPIVLGTAATGTAAIASGSVTGVTISTGGSGYPAPPGVTFIGGGGSGAAAHAVITGGVVTSIVVNNGGLGYSNAPTVLIDPPPIIPAQRFRTLASVALSSQSPTTTVAVEAILTGPAGNVAAGAIDKINAAFAQARLSLGSAQVKVTNANPATGGEQPQADEDYRQVLIGRPRTLWTLEAVQGAVLAVDGVRDCRLSDPLGGVNVSQSKFNFFAFNRRLFGTERQIGTPFFFNILVAVQPGFLWEKRPGETGVQDLVQAVVDEVRPISIFPNLSLADNVQIGIRAIVVLQPGHDGDAVTAAIKDVLEAHVNALGLGNAVLYSQVMCDCKEVTGAADVQQLHLRRFPPVFSGITFGRSPRFGAAYIEMPVGENITLQPNEIAVFSVDSPLNDIQVSQ